MCREDDDCGAPRPGGPVNGSGGVHGRKIRLLSYDDGYEPVKAIECFKRLTNENVFAAAFFVGTPTAEKYVPLAEGAKIPVVGLFTGAQFLYEPFRRYVINVRASYYDESRAQVDNLWNTLDVQHAIDVVRAANPESVVMVGPYLPGGQAYLREPGGASWTRWSWWRGSNGPAPR